MRGSIRWRLAGMMALVYAVQGAWWPLLAIHLQDLGISGRWRGAIFATLALASLLTPLGAGQVADRMMAAPRLLALIYAAGTGLLALAASGLVTDPAALFGLFMAYWLITAPAFGLASAVALRNLERPAEQFGGVRLWGTVGWMAVGWVVSAVLAVQGTTHVGQGAHAAFAVGAVVSALMAAFALTLPETPPLAKGAPPPDLRAGWGLVRRPEVGGFLLVAFGVSLTTPFVYQVVPAYLPTRGLPRAWVASAMTLGQVLEVAGLAVLPGVIRRLGYRGAMATGIAAWVGYHALMALGPNLAWVLAAVPLNGVAIAFFHITGPMYLDSQAPADRRAGMQGVYLLMTSGLGSLLGNLLAGELMGRLGGAVAAVFAVPVALDLVLLAVFLLAFRPDGRMMRARRLAVPRVGRPHAMAGSRAA